MLLPKNRMAVLVAYDGLCAFEYGIAAEIFGLERTELDVPWYRLSTCAAEPGPMKANSGLPFSAPVDWPTLERAGTIVLPGWRGIDDAPPDALLESLVRAHSRGARLVSVCSGVFVLAAVGLLDGRRATTHWRYADALQKRFPRIQVDPDVLYVDEESVLTSAGSAAGIDLCLHVVRCDYGARVANEVARRLVVPPHRDGGQAQFIRSPVDTAPKQALAPLLDWLREHVQAAHTVPSLARRAGMSERTFARQFKLATGSTPLAWLNLQRVDAAQVLLETTDRGIEWIASAVGFGSGQLLRLHFRRYRGTTPNAYRRTFRMTG